MIVPAYAIPVLLALLLALAFPAAQAIPPEWRRVYRGLQLATLVGAIVGAKLAQLGGDHGWPFVALPEGVTLVNSGRSILGGLLGGFLSAELLKPLLGYPLPPNDHFAKILPFSVAIGRIGCLLGGCCRGVPWEGPGAMHYAEEAFGRFPAPWVEIGFNLACGLAFVGLVRARRWRGRVFAAYLVLYGLFRITTEAWRDTPRLLGEWTVYQALALVCVLVGGASWRLRRIDG